MVRFNPKSFAQPDLLNTIQPCYLLRLLEPCRAFLEDRGLSLPREDDEEIDYFKLASILATPDKSMDSRVVEGLNVIGDLATDANFSELLDIARRNSVNVETEATAADLATKIWLEAPQALLENGFDPTTQLEQIALFNKLVDKLEIVLDSDPRNTTLRGQEQPAATEERTPSSKADSNNSKSGLCVAVSRRPRHGQGVARRRDLARGR